MGLKDVANAHGAQSDQARDTYGMVSLFIDKVGVVCLYVCERGVGGGVEGVCV